MDPKPLNRAQLAKICNNDPEAIRLFERLFQVAGNELPNEVEGVSLGGDAVPDAVELDKAIQGQALAQMQAALSELSGGIGLDPPRREFRRACYGQFLDTTTQTAAAINTAYSVAFNTTDISSGVYLSGTQVKVADSGVYNFQISVQLDKTSGGVGRFYIWFAKNGVNIPSSASTIRVQGNDAEVFSALNLFVPMADTDFVELKWAVDDTSVEMVAFAAASPVPAIPSIILTVSNNLEGVK